jgi:LytS/YehU family sensor histidine kinase
VAILGYLILRGGLKDYLMVNNWEKPDAIPFYLLNTWNGFIFEITACGYYLAQKYYREEQNRQQLQTELLHAELAFLKSQTNPHFLYNSLNFIYSQAISVSEPLSKSVLLLSDIMRYALEEADTQGFVPLAKEIKHLENFIEIHRLRFKHKLQVDYRVSLSEAESERRMVLPFVLISLVENAFKHGLVTKAETPLTIHLSLDAGILRFYVKNKMDKNAEKHPTHGVGLKNLERMLTIAYPQKHRLILIEEQDFFIATLELNYLK